MAALIANNLENVELLLHNRSKFVPQYKHVQNEPVHNRNDESEWLEKIADEIILRKDEQPVKDLIKKLMNNGRRHPPISI